MYRGDDLKIKPAGSISLACLHPHSHLLFLPSKTRVPTLWKKRKFNNTTVYLPTFITAPPRDTLLPQIEPPPTLKQNILG